MSARRVPLSRAQAVALGTVHGPAELLPISSSAHAALVPWLLGWDYGELDPELRKTFEVALHAGTAAALLIALRAEATDALASARLRILTALSTLPTALAGYLLERPIEQRLGTRLLERHPPGAHRREHGGVVVDSQHVDASIGERQGEGQAHAPETDDRDGPLRAHEAGT